MSEAKRIDPHSLVGQCNRAVDTLNGDQCADLIPVLRLLADMTAKADRMDAMQAITFLLSATVQREAVARGH